MKDAIDKRNEREKIARSIVKRWNVIYITQEELEQRRREEERLQQEEEERRKAEEILARLEQEAREDERKKAEELESLLRQQEINSHKSSDTYGTSPMDGITQEKVEAILNDKDSILQQLIQDTEKTAAKQKMAESLEAEYEADNAAAETDNEAEAAQTADAVQEEEEKQDMMVEGADIGAEADIADIGMDITE